MKPQYVSMPALNEQESTRFPYHHRHITFHFFEVKKIIKMHMKTNSYDYICQDNWSWRSSLYLESSQF